MEKFIIGGKEYDALVTYRVRRHWVKSCHKDAIANMTFESSDDLVLESIIMCLINKEFTDKEQLYDILTDEEFKTIEAHFSTLLINPNLEGKREIEKKPDPMTAT
ncbi:MAG: hypothetical protein WC455_20505 [Dehalococcoidia bacterium]|jgi:hypothetical protein